VLLIERQSFGFICGTGIWESKMKKWQNNRNERQKYTRVFKWGLNRNKGSDVK
jgi:hypothetical protein